MRETIEFTAGDCSPPHDVELVIETENGPPTIAETTQFSSDEYRKLLQSRLREIDYRDRENVIETVKALSGSIGACPFCNSPCGQEMSIYRTPR